MDSTQHMNILKKQSKKGIVVVNDNEPKRILYEEFPKAIPNGCQMSKETFEHIKNSMVGQPLREQTISNKDLQNAGYKDWTEYCIFSILRNWWWTIASLYKNKKLLEINIKQANKTWKTMGCTS